MARTSMDLEENVASLLCYVLGWVTGLIFILMEKKNRVVRFHAMQSIIVFGTLSVFWAIFGWLLWAIAALFGIMTLFLLILLVIKAYQGGIYKLPVAGDLAEKWAAKVS